MAMSNSQVQRLLVSITCLSLAAVVALIGISARNPLLALLAATVFLISYFYLFDLLASAKGHSTLTAVICGLLPVVGLIILTALPQKGTESPINLAAPESGDASHYASESKLQNREKNLLLILSTILCVLVLFPPFLLFRRSGLKYGFLFSPPEMATVDVSLLVVEIAVASFVVFVIWMVGKKKT